jgi:N-acetylglucosaminyl-diphospho-decaprenol L-rhamnosyltransferase
VADPRSGLDHVLLTRFNLPSVGPESVIRGQNGWLRERVGLFDEYCAPSVRNQTSRNFSWIIYFDPESPDWLRERISVYQAEGLFRPIFRATVSHEELLADIRSTVGPAPAGTLITTNLDNDDGLASDFVERLQSVVAPHSRAALYLVNGLIGSQGDLFLRHDPNNAFCSVRESWADPVACWTDQHPLLGRHMPVVEIGGAPGWLQVVHGSNVSNRIRGRLVSPAPYAGNFGTLLEGWVPPSRQRMIGDRLLAGPRRAVRESVRAGLKWAVIRVLGRAGIDRIKLRVIGWTR